MSRIKKKADEHASSRRRTQINLIEFSFLDHKAELVGLLQAKSRQVGRSLVENEADFWKFVGKYEAMMRSTGQPVLPTRLAEAELSSMQPYHRSKHLALRLDADELLQEARDEMQSQFRHILLVYLDFRQTEKFQRIRKLRQTQRNLPIARFRKDLREALDTSRVGHQLVQLRSIGVGLLVCLLFRFLVLLALHLRLCGLRTLQLSFLLGLALFAAQLLQF